MPFLERLYSHGGLSERKRKSNELLQRVRSEFQNSEYLNGLNLTIYCVGSLARMEIGDKSDLDVFLTAENCDGLKSKLVEYTVISELIKINQILGFPEFSNDGEYLKIYFIDDLKKRTGSRFDDHENYFTARLLMMLESKAVLNKELYNKHLSSIIKHYYRDKQSKKSFKPLFLVNDILRYWRTLCLNYEERRHDPKRHWRKKNVNLKFSRMVTVFSTILPILILGNPKIDELKSLFHLTPIERLAKGLNLLNDHKLLDQWDQVIDEYETFLTWKDDDNIEKYLEGGEQKETVRQYAANLSIFLYTALTNEKIPFELRRYLVL